MVTVAKAPTPYLTSGDPSTETLLKLRKPASLITYSHTHRNFWDATTHKLRQIREKQQGSKWWVFSRLLTSQLTIWGPYKLEHHRLYINQKIGRWTDRQTWGPSWFSSLNCSIFILGFFQYYMSMWVAKLTTSCWVQRAESGIWSNLHQFQLPTELHWCGAYRQKYWLRSEGDSSWQLGSKLELPCLDQLYAAHSHFSRKIIVIYSWENIQSILYKC